MSGVPEPPSESTESPAAPPGPEDVLGRRISAALIDLALLVGLFVVLALTIGESKVEGGSASLSLNGADAGLYFALVLIYYFALEVALGQTVGKVLLGLRVVRSDGSPPSALAIAVRTLLRIVDWLPLLYLVGFITMMATGSRHLRLGDLAAKTTLARASMRHRSLALASVGVLLLAIVASSVYRVADSGGATKSTLKAVSGKIAFGSGRGCRDVNNEISEIFVMNADGSGQTNLTNTHAAEFAPAWSPDGRKIVFTGGRINFPPYEIFVMNADGSGRKNLTKNSAGQNFDPDWSPDGTKIAYTRGTGPESTHEIFVMNADGSGATNLTNNPEDDDSAAWSPDGRRIAFATDRTTDDAYEIFVMNADGSGATNLTNTAAEQDQSPSWSPDGTTIAFTRGLPPYSDVFVMNADGSGQTNLTTNPAGNYNGDWKGASTASAPSAAEPRAARLPLKSVATVASFAPP